MGIGEVMKERRPVTISFGTILARVNFLGMDGRLVIVEIANCGKHLVAVWNITEVSFRRWRSGDGVVG